MKAIALSGALILLGIVGASAADTFKFTDVRGVHGQARGMAAKSADALKCGWTKDDRIVWSVPAMEKCMLSRGWEMTQYTPDPSGSQQNTVQYTDLSRSGKRGDAALHADGAKCAAARLRGPGLARVLRAVCLAWAGDITPIFRQLPSQPPPKRTTTTRLPRPPTRRRASTTTGAATTSSAAMTSRSRTWLTPRTPSTRSRLPTPHRPLRMPPMRSDPIERIERPVRVPLPDHRAPRNR